MPIAKEISNMLDLGRKAITSNFGCFFASKIQKLQRIKGCTHRAMILCDGAVDSHQKE